MCTSHTLTLTASSDVNYFGCINTTHFALPHLKKSKRGIIVVVSSLAGRHPTPQPIDSLSGSSESSFVGTGIGAAPQRTGYCASKFALHGTCAVVGSPPIFILQALKPSFHLKGFFETLRIELAKYNIQVTMICPGMVQTNINNTRLGPSPSNWYGMVRLSLLSPNNSPPIFIS